MRDHPILSLAALAARLTPKPLRRAIYRTGPFARAIRQMLNRAAPGGLTEVEVAAGPLAGTRLSLDLKSEKDYWLGTYETEVLHTLQDLIRPGMVVYDLGANIGYLTLLIARLVGDSGRVFAMEALPDNLDRLHANLALNRLTDRVEVIAGAVIDHSATVRFLQGPSGGMGKAEGSAGRRTQYRAAITVPGISLDDFVYHQGNPAPQIIKMDIEGGEVLALAGMSRILSAARPVMLLELHGEESSEGAWRHLSAAGYRLSELRSGYPDIPGVEGLDWKAYVLARPQERQPRSSSARRHT